jgi:dihydrofolate reductase
MRKIIVLERITLDGVFDAASMDKWDFPYHSEAKVAFIFERIHASGAYLLGRTTYELHAPYWSPLKNNEHGIADKLNSMAKYVVSSTLDKAEWNNSTIIKANVLGEISKLKEQPGQDILVMGSAKLVQRLLLAGLVDELQLLINPVVMGSGAKFFKDQTQHAKLKLIEAKSLDLGVVLLRYKPDLGVKEA